MTLQSVSFLSFWLYLIQNIEHCTLCQLIANSIYTRLTESHYLHSFSLQLDTCICSSPFCNTMAANDVPCCETMFWVYLVICVALVSFAGLMSGLTLGLMSLSLVDLEVLMKAGQPEDRKNAGHYNYNHLITSFNPLTKFMIIF